MKTVLITLTLIIGVHIVSLGQYTYELVDVYKMSKQNNMEKLATKKVPMDVTINAKNIYVFDKTSGEKEVYNVEEKVNESGRAVIFAISNKTNLSYKFTIIDEMVTIFYDYEKSTDTYRSALMLHN